MKNLPKIIQKPVNTLPVNHSLLIQTHDGLEIVGMYRDQLGRIFLQTALDENADIEGVTYNTFVRYLVCEEDLVRYCIGTLPLVLLMQESKHMRLYAQPRNLDLQPRSFAMTFEDLGELTPDADSFIHQMFIPRY